MNLNDREWVDGFFTGSESVLDRTILELEALDKRVRTLINRLKREKGVS